MISEYSITYWHHGEELTQYSATVCAKDKAEAAKLFGQFYRDCEIIGIRRVVPERESPTHTLGQLARLLERCA